MTMQRSGMVVDLVEWKLKLLGWRFRKTPYDAQMRKKPLWDAMARSFAGRRISY